MPQKIFSEKVLTKDIKIHALACIQNVSLASFPEMMLIMYSVEPGNHCWCEDDVYALLLQFQ